MEMGDLEELSSLGLGQNPFGPHKRRHPARMSNELRFGFHFEFGFCLFADVSPICYRFKVACLR